VCALILFGFSIGFAARRSRLKEVDMAGPLQREQLDSPQWRDTTVLERQTHSSAGPFDGAVTGLAGILRLLLIVALLVMLTFLGAVWFGLHPLFKSIDYRSQSPVVIQKQAPEPQPTPAPPAPPIRTPAPSP
jgi:hypothetical protein